MHGEIKTAETGYGRQNPRILTSCTLGGCCCCCCYSAPMESSSPKFLVTPISSIEAAASDSISKASNHQLRTLWIEDSHFRNLHQNSALRHNLLRLQILRVQAASDKNVKGTANHPVESFKDHTPQKFAPNLNPPPTFPRTHPQAASTPGCCQKGRTQAEEKRPGNHSYLKKPSSRLLPQHQKSSHKQLLSDKQPKNFQINQKKQSFLENLTKTKKTNTKKQKKIC